MFFVNYNFKMQFYNIFIKVRNFVIIADSLSLSNSSEKLHSISDEIKILVVILLRIFEPYSWVSFWVSSRKITSLDDANSFLFNAYSASSKKLYAIRAPDHPPTKILEISTVSRIFYFSILSTQKSQPGHSSSKCLKFRKR